MWCHVVTGKGRCGNRWPLCRRGLDRDLHEVERMVPAGIAKAWRFLSVSSDEELVWLV